MNLSYIGNSLSGESQILTFDNIIQTQENRGPYISDLIWIHTSPVPSSNGGRSYALPL
jgi:hypothetical protein